MPEQKKKKPFVNLIDVGFVLLIIAAVVVAYLYLNQSTVSGDDATVFFTVEFKNKDIGYTDGIEKGMLVKDSIKGNNYGYVESVEEVPDFLVVYNKEKEEFVHAFIPEKVRVHLTIKASGAQSESAVTAEGLIVRVGQQVFIKGKGFASEGYIVDLEVQ